ncbi:hypothetical protein [Haliangium sp.]|uniref:hypothetical protein n=1 Tax=Haliangium sp. TaxID=2663208 RepID=UPI003D123FAD
MWLLALALVLLAGACGGGSNPDDPPPISVDAGVPETGQCLPGVVGVPGAEGCACLADDRCDGDLRCSDGFCEVCPPGQEDCGCLADETCDGDLTCMGGVCAQPTCSEGALDCPCRGPEAEDRCDDNSYCADSGVCEQCQSDVEGCPCDLGECGGDLVCGDGELCRTPLTCEDLRKDGLCGNNQQCDQGGPGLDAQCVVGACVDGFHWVDGEDGLTPGCAPDATCVAGVLGSIARECAETHRTCVEDPAGEDFCGDCLPTARAEDGECVPEIDCGGVVCGVEQYCDRSVEDAPVCLDWPCDQLDQAVNTIGECATCAASCQDVDGSTGRIWPFTTRDDSCVCETLPDYFLSTSGEDRRPQQCDADNDNWVRDEIRHPNITGSDADPTLAQNMRCDVLTVDRVVLQDEYGLSVTVHSCAEGLIKSETGEVDPLLCDPERKVPLRLLESERNDVPGRPDADADTPAYGGPDGRRLRAEELTALTKACVSSDADFNGDGVEDIDQVQDTRPDTSTLGETSRLRSFAYFVELYTARYQASETGPLGRLIIAERPRCDGDFFPLVYTDDDVLTSYDSEQAGSYWRSCTRKRDPNFDADSGRAGYDFAQWTCDPRRESCATPAPAHPSIDAVGGLDPDQVLMREHGLCELGEGQVPADGRWRGMNHHSQFRCVAVAENDPGLPRHTAAPDDFSAGADQTLTMNDCHAVRCDEVDCVESRDGGWWSASDPVVRCEARAGTPEVGEVGWAAVGYSPYGHVAPNGSVDGEDYAGSCINEDAEWEFLCPVPEFGLLLTAPLEAFGRFRCFGWESFFLWAEPGESEQDHDRSSLLWAAPGEQTPNTSVWR